MPLRNSSHIGSEAKNHFQSAGQARGARTTELAETEVHAIREAAKISQFQFARADWSHRAHVACHCALLATFDVGHTRCLATERRYSRK
jgi:hypothetical protein